MYRGVNMATRTAEYAPVIMGARIDGTDLVQRTQGGKVISPAYMGKDGPGEAMRQAGVLGLRSVTAYGMTYVHFGQWYGWNLPSLD
jgi:hypothetical protein